MLWNKHKDQVIGGDGLEGKWPARIRLGVDLVMPIVMIFAI